MTTLDVSIQGTPWTLKRNLVGLDPGPQPGEGLFTGRDLPRLPSGASYAPTYVNVTGPGIAAPVLLKVTVNPAGQGRCVFVAPATLAGIAAETPLTCAPRTAGDVRRYAFWHDPRLRVARWALAAAVLGSVIDASLAIGGAARDASVPWVIRVDASTIAWTIGLSTVLKLGGALLLFWKGFLEWDPK